MKAIPHFLLLTLSMCGVLLVSEKAQGCSCIEYEHPQCVPLMGEPMPCLSRT